MISLLPDYVPMQILVGMGVGLVGGLLALFFAPLPIRKHPASYADTAAFLLLAFVVALPILFPMTLFLALALTFLSIWIVPPILFSGKKKTIRTSSKQRINAPLTAHETPPRIREIRDAVDMLSPEGRATVLEDMRIFQ